MRNVMRVMCGLVVMSYLACIINAHAENSSTNTDLHIETISLSVTIIGLPKKAQLGVTLNDGQTILLSTNGKTTLAQRLAPFTLYHLRVVKQPSDAYCNVMRGIGKTTSTPIEDIQIQCTKGEAAATAKLFDTDQLRKIRFTISADNWNAFTLSSARSHQRTNLYRPGLFEYFESDGSLLATLPNVAFRMRGNSSRTVPELTSKTGDPTSLKPTRFHINLKFDEDFKGDEGAYSCIDKKGNGLSAADCADNKIDDVATISANDNRTFMGMESVSLKMNKDDPSYLREALANTISRDNGVVAGRAAHIAFELVITPSQVIKELFGEKLPVSYQMGIYTIVEPIDKIFVKNNIGKNGFLFKVNGSSLTKGDAENCFDYDTAVYGYTNANYCMVGVEKTDPTSRADWLGERFILKEKSINPITITQNLPANCGDTLGSNSTSSSSSNTDEIAYHIRGSFNGWTENAVMTRTANPNIYEYCAYLPNPKQSTEELGFKIDPNGGWGDDAFPADNVSIQPGWMKISLNTANKKFTRFMSYKPIFDLKTKKDELINARAELNSFIVIINSKPTQEKLSAIFDVDSFIRTQAVDIVAGAADHYVRGGSNYYLYKNPNDKKWHYISYDNDFTFRNNAPAQWGESPKIFSNIIATTIFTGNTQRWNDTYLGDAPILYQIIFADKANQAKLITQIGELRRTWLNWEYRIKPITDVWLKKLELTINTTTASNPPFGDTLYNRNAATAESYSNEFGISKDTIKNYIEQRNDSLKKETE